MDIFVTVIIAAVSLFSAGVALGIAIGKEMQRKKSIEALYRIKSLITGEYFKIVSADEDKS